MVRVRSIGSWRLPELLLMSSIANISPLLDIFYLGFRDLPRKVAAGELDKHLYRPCSPILGMLSEHLYLRYPLCQAGVALALFAWAVRWFGIRLHLAGTLRGLALLVLSVYVLRFFNGVVTLSTFWFGKIDDIRAVLAGVSSLTRYPVTIYRDAVRRLETYFLPYGLAATYPTLALTGWVPPAWFWACMVALVLGWGLVFRAAWRAALRRYEAYGG